MQKVVMDSGEMTSIVSEFVWGLLSFLAPYAFVQSFFLRFILFWDAVPASLPIQRLFALTVAVCFQSHFVLLLDVLDVGIKDPAGRTHLFTLHVLILLILAVLVLPALMFFYMTRTVIRWRRTATLLSELCFLVLFWQIGRVFPTDTNKGM